MGADARHYGASRAGGRGTAVITSVPRNSRGWGRGAARHVGMYRLSWGLTGGGSPLLRDLSRGVGVGRYPSRRRLSWGLDIWRRFLYQGLSCGLGRGWCLSRRRLSRGLSGVAVTGVTSGACHGCWVGWWGGRWPAHSGGLAGNDTPHIGDHRVGLDGR